MTDKKVVLLVEDDDAVRKLVRISLELSDYQVVEAKDGLEGLLMLDMHHPDAVVLDLMMPDVGGERMLTQLRATPETRQVPVVIIDPKGSPALEATVRAHGGQVWTLDGRLRPICSTRDRGRCLSCCSYLLTPSGR